jgi:hypothetical protein
MAASGAPVGCSGGVVGGECRRGFSVCDNHCVDLAVDTTHCGACGTTCGDGQSCIEGVCSPGPGAGGAGAASGGAGASGHPDASVDAGSGGTSGSGGDASIGAGGGSGAGGFSGDASVEGGTGGGPTDAAAGNGGTASGGFGGAGGKGGVAGSGGTGGAAGGSGAGGGTASDGGPDAATCPPPYDTPEHCGNCFTHCTNPTPLCELGIESYQCVSLCTPPLVACGGKCVNTDNDENNCGRCGHRCASQICQGGQCVGANAGHIVVFCADYRQKAQAGSPQETLLGNAVFLSRRNPVRVFAYSEHTPANVVTAVNATIQSAATAAVRTAPAITQATTATAVSLQLNILDYDVLLVYDQPTAPAGYLGNVGSLWSSSIDAFVRAGGVVVVLAGDGGRAEMDDLLTNAGLLAATAQTSITGNPVYNRAPADAVGIGVLSTFRASRETCTFTVPTSTDPSTVFVVTDTPLSAGSIGAPVVVHRVLSP